MRINHNISAMITQGAVFIVNRSLAQNMEKLSTGLRINKASDDAAGLAISEKLRTQVRGAEQARRNALDGMSAINIAEGAANEISSILQRQRELAIQSATATYSNTERIYLNQEYQQLCQEIDRICKVTNFNGIKLLDSGVTDRFGSTGNCELWIDANHVTGVDSIFVSYDTISVADFNLLGIGSQKEAQTEITSIDNAIFMVNTMRANLGAYINRLESTVNNLGVSINNQQAAESQIRDTDFATETSSFTRNQIIAQTSVSMLAQANQIPNLVLQLVQ